MVNEYISGKIFVDSKGIISKWDKGAEKIFGYKPEEIEGKELSQLIPEEYRAQHEVGFNRAIQVGREITMSMYLPTINSDGKYINTPMEIKSIYEVDKLIGMECICFSPDGNDIPFKPFFRDSNRKSLDSLL